MASSPSHRTSLKKDKPMFGRVIAAMVTPLKEDGSVNYAMAEQLAAHLVDSGNDGLVVCGTTGESPTLTWDEEYELFQVVQKAIAPKGRVIAGTGSNSTTEAISATQKAARLGLDGSLQVVPYYNRPPQEGLYRHFAAIAKAVPEMPIMLYNIPGRTGRNLEPETIARLSELGNIVAIKEASGDLEQVCAIRSLTPDRFMIYSGEDSLTLPMLALGAAGVVSVASHLVAQPLQRLIQAFESGQVAQARALQLQLFPLFKVLFCTTNPIPIKAALQLQGWPVGPLRSPLCELSAEQQQQLEQVMSQLQLI
ncbi:MAG: 4-hydroxy-tetrahydrodipicolinate synthase [Chloroflexaceae bacterium]|nr:4-hydroxy-tetrahydrodipicolinate synthase [Chloroflexaceae bacterium]